MKYAALFLTLGPALVIEAVICRGLYWLLVWPGMSLTLVGLAYLRLGPSVFGKKSDGTMAWYSVALLLPYLLVAWVVWHVARIVGREDCYNEAAPGLFVGRRPRSNELPNQRDGDGPGNCGLQSRRRRREHQSPSQLRNQRGLPGRLFSRWSKNDAAASTPKESMNTSVTVPPRSGTNVWCHSSETAKTTQSTTPTATFRAARRPVSQFTAATKNRSRIANSIACHPLTIVNHDNPQKAWKLAKKESL